MPSTDPLPVATPPTPPPTRKKGQHRFTDNYRQMYRRYSKLCRSRGLKPFTREEYPRVMRAFGEAFYADVLEGRSAILPGAGAIRVVRRKRSVKIDKKTGKLLASIDWGTTRKLKREMAAEGNGNTHGCRVYRTNPYYFVFHWHWDSTQKLPPFRGAGNYRFKAMRKRELALNDPAYTKTLELRCN